MFRMAVGHSDDIDVERALDAVIEECEAVLAGAVPSAGLLLASWDSDHRALIDRIRAPLPGHRARRHQRRRARCRRSWASPRTPSPSPCSRRTPSTSWRAWAATSSRDPVAASRAAVADARSRSDLPPSLCIAMTTVGQVEASVILDALRAALGPDVPILGGGASPRDPADDPRHGNDAGREIVGDVVTERRDRDPAVLRAARHVLRRRYGVARCRADGDGHGPVGRQRGRDRRAGPRSSSTSGTSARSRRRSPTRSRCSRPANRTRFYLRTPIAYDQATGCVSFFGAIPSGAKVQLTVAATDEIFDGARASIADALATFPAGHTPGRRADLLVRDAPLPPRDAGPARDRGGPRRPRHGDAARRRLLPGRDRPDGGRRPVAVPQRDDGLDPARLPVIAGG